MRQVALPFFSFRSLLLSFEQKHRIFLGRVSTVRSVASFQTLLVRVNHEQTPREADRR